MAHEQILTQPLDVFAGSSNLTVRLLEVCTLGLEGIISLQAQRMNLRLS